MTTLLPISPANTQRVVWHEGLFLTPQHLQQHDRYWSDQSLRQLRTLQSHYWGLTEITFDQELLQTGQLVCRSVSGIFKNGVAFDAPTKDRLPDPIHLQTLELDVDDSISSVMIYLTLPTPTLEQAEFNIQPNKAPYHICRLAVDDVVATTNTNEQADLLKTNDYSDQATHPDPRREVYVGQLQLQMIVATPPPIHQTYLPFGSLERDDAGYFTVLNTTQLPTLHCQAHAQIKSDLLQVHEMMQARTSVLARRVSHHRLEPSAKMWSALTELMTLNRYQAQLASWSNHPSELHPADLHRTLLGLVAELATVHSQKATLTLQDIKDNDLIYRHNLSVQSIHTLCHYLTHRLSSTPDSAIPITLKQVEGAYCTEQLDANSLSNSRWIIEIHTRTLPDLNTGALKVSGAEQIIELDRNALPGLMLTQLSEAPHELVPNERAYYVEIEPNQHRSMIPSNTWIAPTESNPESKQHPLWLALLNSESPRLVLLPNGTLETQTQFSLWRIPRR